jgi:hypothetical protein
MGERLLGTEEESNLEGAGAPERQMPADHVIEVYDLLRSHDIDVWIDEGWGVDALLGDRTRAMAT